MGKKLQLDFTIEKMTDSDRELAKRTRKTDSAGQHIAEALIATKVKAPRIVVAGELDEKQLRSLAGTVNEYLKKGNSKLRVIQRIDNDGTKLLLLRDAGAQE